MSGAATDVDSGENGRVTYSLEGSDAGKFVVNVNGKISAQSTLDDLVRRTS